MSSSTDSRSTQRSRILALLIEARGAWVGLPEILALGIAQYNARLFELRQMGFVIQNRVDRDNGRRLSYFRLVAGPAAPTHSILTLDLPTGRAVRIQESEQGESQQEAPLSLFGDLTPEPEYPD
jgi:hypothetical protein